MTLPPPPEAPLYRITLFYGPEQVEGQPSRLHCVFNVKKRSWKGGVQVSVQLEAAQVAQAARAADLDVWIEGVLTRVEVGARADYAGRAKDLFVQVLCAAKLDLALGSLQQENATLAAATLAVELEQALPGQRERIKAQILTELDIPAGKDGV